MDKKMNWDYKKQKKYAKKLADNLELFSGERSCKMCGSRPEFQVDYIQALLHSAHLKWNKEMREMIEEVSNHPIEVVGNSALAFNQFRKELLKQLEENL
jgi:hypothetical protein